MAAENTPPGTGRLITDVTDQLTFDCSSMGGSASDDCMKKSAAGRRTFRPQTEYLVTTMYKNYKLIVAEDAAKLTDKSVRILVCHYSFHKPLTSTDLLSRLVKSLSIPRDTRRKRKVDKYLRTIADQFKAPLPFFKGNMTALVQKVAPVKMTYQVCIERYFDKVMSLDAKAMALLMIKMLVDNTTVTLGQLDNLKGEVSFAISAINASHKGSKDMIGQVSSVLVKFLQEAEKILDNQTTSSSVNSTIKMESTKTAIELREYGQLLKVQKYDVKPLQISMTEKGRVRDIKERFLPVVNETYGRRASSSYINFSPTLLYCDFGKEMDSHMCQTAMGTFTHSGLGYSFNTEGFFKMFRKNKFSESFCHEIVERTDLVMCGATEKEIANVNSGAKSLRLLLHTPRKYRHEWYNQRLAVHSPYSIADTFDIEPRPGMHTTVVITLHETVTDESLLEEDQSVRKCHSQKIDGNPLKLFHNYTKENCLYECHVKRSTEVCGCVPWGFPIIDKGAQLCSRWETDCFNEEMENTDDSSDCSHCLDDCTRVAYQYTIHTKLLKDVCRNNPKMRDAVNRVVNSQDLLNFLPPRDYLQDTGLDYHLLGPCFSYARKNVALVEFKIARASAVRNTRRIRVTFLQQVSSIGKHISYKIG